MTSVRIGTRGSKLALWQANAVAARLSEQAGAQSEIVIIRTSGDESSGPPDPPPAGANVKGLFVKEIEDALLNGDIDLAVHSSKDLSASLPEGLALAVVLPREDARDAVLLPNVERVADVASLTRRLGATPRFGTSSVRRVAQLKSLFPRATFLPLRGNVDTRIRKLAGGECDAAVLASAGLKRLGLDARIALAIPIETCVPAPGQGIVAIEIREERADVASLLQRINDDDAMDALVAERAVVSALGGSCQMPLGAHARLVGTDLSIIGVVISPDGLQLARADAQGPRTSAAAVGQELAQALVRQGALKILSG